jgi:DNA-directed RNA polymerase subunit M/transcription elongation factor TFIIS
MDSIVKFCPDCSSIFTYDKSLDSKLILKCKRCNYVEEENVKMHFIKSSNYQSNKCKYAIPIENTKYDQTMLRTSTQHCPNIECPCNVDSLILPEILLGNKSSPDRIMTMTCAHCSTSWS